MTSTLRFELLPRVGAEVPFEHREDLGASLDQDDPSLLLRQTRVVLVEIRPVELGECSGGLDPRRPTSNHDDLQPAVVDKCRCPCPLPPSARTWSSA